MIITQSSITGIVCLSFIFLNFCRTWGKYCWRYCKTTTGSVKLKYCFDICFLFLFFSPKSFPQLFFIIYIQWCKIKCSIFKENLKCYFYFDISLTRWEARLPFMFNKLKESNNSVYSCCKPTFTWKLQQSNNKPEWISLNWQGDSQLSSISWTLLMVGVTTLLD